MKITIITSPFGCIPPNAIGAIEKRWYEVARILASEGHTLQFISKRSNKRDVNELYQDGVLIKFLNGYTWKKWLVFNLVLDFVYSLKALFTLPKTEILILNTFWTPLLCHFFSWKYKVSVYNVARFPKGQFKYYKSIDRLSCVSTAVYNELLRQIPQWENRIKVISNPVNVRSFYYVEEPNTEKIIIMYAGRVHPEKGLDILIKAYDKLKEQYPNIELVLVGATSIEKGGGGNEYVQTLNGLTKFKIQYVAPIYDQDLLAKEIARCNIFCYPSIAEKGETFGVAPLEAMALGRATVVSSLDCFLDFVKDEENAFIFNHKENAVNNLKNILELLILNPEKRSCIGKIAAKSALAFSTSNIAQLYLNDFTELLNTKNVKTKI